MAVVTISIASASQTVGTSVFVIHSVTSDRQCVRHSEVTYVPEMAGALDRVEGAVGAPPTDQEAAVLAEVLQRELALADADPQALSQVCLVLTLTT